MNLSQEQNPLDPEESIHEIRSHKTLKSKVKHITANY